MNKGFINILAAGLIGVAFMASSVFYVQYETKKVVQERLGASITTTTLSNTINQFRTQSNTNFENINTELSAVSSSLINVSNTLNLVPISKGGTGTSTTPGQERFLVGDGTKYQLRAFVASSGLTLSTTTESWTLSTQGLNTAAAFTWTGAHTHNATTTFASTTVFNGSTTWNQLPTYTATATVGIEAINKNYADSVVMFISSAATSTYATTTAGISDIPTASSTFTLSTARRVLVNFVGFGSNSTSTNGSLIFLNIDGTDTDVMTAGRAAAAGGQYNISFSYLTSQLSAAQHTIKVRQQPITGGEITANVRQFSIVGYGY